MYELNWIEVTILTTSMAVDAVSNVVFELGANVSISDPGDLKGFKTDLNWVILDESLKAGEDVIIKAYFPKSEDVENKINYIKEQLTMISEYLDIGKGTVTSKVIDEEDWANGWKKYYKTIKVTERIVINPIWEEYQPLPGEIVLKMDPGMAFGTGTHETTRMCLKLLERYVAEGKTVYDIGCGSGILSICADLLGAKKVIGCDLDPVAISASNSNAGLNNTDNIDFREGNLLDVFEGRSDIIVANIGADAIIYLAGIVKKYLEKDGLFISSGIILDRSEEVKIALERQGFEITEILTEGEWVAIVCRSFL